MFANYGYYSYPAQDNAYVYQGYTTSVPVHHNSSVPDSAARYVEHHRSSSPERHHRRNGNHDGKKREHDLRRSHIPPRDYNA